MELMREWYLLLSRVNVTLGEPLKQWSDALNAPMLSALLLGLLGATAPCQLTTNLSAIAYVSRRPGEGRSWVEAVTYTLGKVLVYTLAGGAIIVLGLQIQASTVPVVVLARKLLGPLMIVIGLVFLGLVNLRLTVGQRLAEAIQRRLPARGAWGAFLMGVVFSFAFCPTLFLLFFGLTIPLGLRSRAGVLIPALFALGTALPLLAYAALLRWGATLAGGDIERLSRSHTVVRRVGGAIFIIAGVNDTLTYWAL
ncbi:MAG: sulfite exporter TauE/SafE family protein [Candidatus Rokubacteria bacterium]|nr:sulfite exporter TauE/SafE family protein [Candidatus Rokubacteria bacterium]